MSNGAQIPLLNPLRAIQSPSKSATSIKLISIYLPIRHLH